MRKTHGDEPAVSIEKYLGDGQIEQVICGGENYDGARPCDFEWVKSLRAECVAHDIFHRNGYGIYQGREALSSPQKAGTERDGI